MKMAIDAVNRHPAMASPLYSLRWNNHQSHMLHAFDTLLQSEALVDVTLVCEDTRRLRAHKVVLSACSPFFEKIFAETPCKHPVIVLKDIRSYELQGIVDFMYKGEISVLEEQLPNLMKAAESLQIRGLYHNEPSFAQSPPHVSLERFSHFSPHHHGGLPSGPPPPPGSHPSHPSQPGFLKDDINGPALSPYSPDGGIRDRSPLRLPVMPHISFGDGQNSGTPSGDHYCASPLPRRKQARPRRRSGEQGSGNGAPGNGNGTPTGAGGQAGPQDLSKAAAAPAATPQPAPARSPAERLADVAENLSTKRGRPSSVGVLGGGSGSGGHSSRQSTPAPVPVSAPATEPLSGDESQSTDAPLDMMAPDRRDFNHLGDASHPSLLSLRPDSGLENSTFPSMPSLSALALTTPPHGLFPGMDAVRNPLLNEPIEARAENHLSSSSGGGGPGGGGPTGAGGAGSGGKRSKSKWNDVNRPKGQHSAPRGGPPRSWTNAELTEALQQVWNKKMTTSQASRIFGIPYNSLLMYVRGKYGKSLKLEQLRKDCQGGPMGPLELLGLGPPPLGHNNNISKDHSHQLDEAPTGLGGADPDVLAFNPYHQGANFYPEFGAFPLPVSMMHLLPQSEKARAAGGLQHPPPSQPPPGLPLALDFASFRGQSDKDADREELIERERERERERAERERERERERDAERERKRERKVAAREQSQQRTPPPSATSPSSPSHMAAPENNNAADHTSKLMLLDDLPTPAAASELNGQE